MVGNGRIMHACGELGYVAVAAALAFSYLFQLEGVICKEIVQLIWD